MTDAISGPVAGQETPQPGPVEAGPKGLGGWLVLPLLHFLLLPIAYPGGVILSVVLELKRMQSQGEEPIAISDLAALLTLSFDDWVRIIASDPGSFTELAEGLTILVPILGLWVLSIVCLVQMLWRSSSFPTLAIVYYAAALGFSAVFLLVSRTDIMEFTDIEKRAALKDAIRSFWAALIWINYFRLSKRVKNTFVN